MTGFFERLLGRGVAGSTLRPRPRARFEPPTLGADHPGAASSSVVAVSSEPEATMAGHGDEEPSQPRRDRPRDRSSDAAPSGVFEPAALRAAHRDDSASDAGAMGDTPPRMTLGAIARSPAEEAFSTAPSTARASHEHGASSPEDRGGAPRRPEGTSAVFDPVPLPRVVLPRIDARRSVEASARPPAPAPAVGADHHRPLDSRAASPTTSVDHDAGSSTVVTVHIGRLEIREAPRPPTREPGPAPRPMFTLEDYLRDRREGRR